ncbi:hypothetical protein BC834DRAFT_867632 [Gloeopeniophorella convolvens]|nr:hypothetical protein BC834DRAFT_867632 [Gloeopeniophorella convolvens]
MTSLVITPEATLPAGVIPPLDPSLFQPSEDELSFLKTAISDDEAEIRRRVDEVQHEAYASHPYPCVRAYHHISLKMSLNNIYPRVLSRAKEDPSAILLDIGCCMGTDVRKLVNDGYPASRVVGVDLRPEFLTLGHKLYSDADTCPIHFFAADMFSISIPANLPPAPAPQVETLNGVSSFEELIGRVSFVYTGALFHLFDESTQHAIALRVALLLKRQPGSAVFGRHQGLPEAGMIDDHMQRVRYGHSPASWERLWKTVFETTDGPEFAKRVKVDAELRSVDASVSTGRVAPYFLFWSVEIA